MILRDDQIKCALSLSLSHPLSVSLWGGPAFALSKSATQIILGAQIGVKRREGHLKSLFIHRLPPPPWISNFQ